MNGPNTSNYEVARGPDLASDIDLYTIERDSGLPSARRAQEKPDGLR